MDSQQSGLSDAQPLMSTAVRPRTVSSVMAGWWPIISHAAAVSPWGDGGGWEATGTWHHVSRSRKSGKPVHFESTIRIEGLLCEIFVVLALEADSSMLIELGDVCCIAALARMR